MIDFTITITGTAPLLMHSSRLANPLDPSTRALKKVTAKRTKTEEDYEEMARIEHGAGLYLIPKVGPYIPGENIMRCLVDAAKITKRGRDITRGVLITTDENPVSYKGPRTTDALWADENFRLMSPVKVGMARVMRCRPMFREWVTQADGILDPQVMNLDDLVGIVATAGQMIGLGDWRPRYGRFSAALVQVKAVAV